MVLYPHLATALRQFSLLAEYTSGQLKFEMVTYLFFWNFRLFLLLEEV